MNWKNTIKKEFDEHGRDFDEQGLDQDGKPLPEEDNFLDDMEFLIKMYKRWQPTQNSGSTYRDRQLNYIKEMLELCQEEIKLREA